MSYRFQPSRSERAKAIGAVVVIHVLAAVWVLTSTTVVPDAIEHARTVLIDIQPPPPPPPPETRSARAKEEEGAAGKKADPTPVVVPKPRVELPAKSPVPAAPVAGTGSSSSAGAATAGTGTGAGGSGSGRGGGGAGGIGTQARLLSGGLSRRDYRALRSFGATSGRAVLQLTVGPEGRVDGCSIAQSSGDPRVDSSLCAILQPRMRWSPALGRDGRPISIRAFYVANWDR